MMRMKNLKTLPASTVVSRHDPNLMNALQVSIMSLRPNEELWKAHKRQLTDPWVGQVQRDMKK
ncbi:MAG: hypothetical protein CM15mP109_10340 [Candidatus Dadabacteria bacterium]|nr:MAG: hypothetical protein CM15mP109_10340 [Candidatus Dadabacteria bacterium]